MSDKPAADFDLFIIGGGINGAGIARDAAGRGLRVALCEMNDFASGTSGASSKLIHGGLRYLEQYKFRLVREALAEREVLLRAAPHLVRPMAFVLPQMPGMRPGWMIRAGLWLYDHLGLYDRLGGKSSLPRSRALTLAGTAEGAPLRSDIREGFVYSDCWVDDARLVIGNIRAAADLGARILPRTRCVAARRSGPGWVIATENRQTNTRESFTARALVNAAGPWVQQVIDGVLAVDASARIDASTSMAGSVPSLNSAPSLVPAQAVTKLQLIKGSHIVVPRLYEVSHAYLLQNDDRRIVFILPYEHHYTLIGTTDLPLVGGEGPDDPAAMQISAAEIGYLCGAASRYLATRVDPGAVVWSYAGVRALYDDGSPVASEITRDYVLELDGDGRRAPVLSVFGGKITTYRRLAEQALAKLAAWFPAMQPAWTASRALPGGDMADADFTGFCRQLHQAYANFSEEFLTAIARRHGTCCSRILRDAKTPADLGAAFGAGLTVREVDYLLAEEWACDATDILWRRTKCGLHMSPAQRAAFAAYIDSKSGQTPQTAFQER